MRHVCGECGEAGDPGACGRDGTTRTPVGSDPLLGTQIGSWRVACLLGAGGMGRVYKAVQPEIGARVAIKVLKREASEAPDLVERFFNEARAVNVIRHDSIVDVIDLGRLPDGTPYIVMEYLEGASLNALLRRPGRLPLGTFARWIAEALAALSATHAKGIVHRDFKPDNVFISPTGRVTVLDFGIAKLGGPAGIVGGTTQTGSLLGTPAYMAPEQARSQPVDARADLYAAGVILFEGATGAQPFSAASLYELLDMHVKRAPPKPRSLQPGIPEALEAVILRALAKEPADRFESAAAMREALLASLEGLPSDQLVQVIVASPTKVGPPSDPYAPTQSTQASLAHGETMPSASPSPRRATPRDRRALLFGIAALLGVGTIATVFALRGSSERDPGPAATPPVVQASPGPDAALAPVAAPDAEVVVVSPRLRSPEDAGGPADGKRRTAPDAEAVVVAPVAPSEVAIDAPAAPIPPPKLLAATPKNLEQGSVSIPIADPRRFDPFAAYPGFQAEAERLVGARVAPLGLNWDRVGRDGTIDTTTSAGYAIYYFMFAARAIGDETYCILEIKVENGRGAGTLMGGACGGRPTAPPSCPYDKVRTMAEFLGLAPDAPFVHLHRIGVRQWQVSMTAGTSGSKFSEAVEDDCR